MLKINRKSWHYRITQWTWNKVDSWYEPNDLCTYFWSMVAVPFIFICSLMLGLVLLGVALLWNFGPAWWGIYILFIDPVFVEVTCDATDSAKDCVPEIFYVWSWIPYALFLLQTFLWWAVWRVVIVEKNLTPDNIKTAFGVCVQQAKAFKEGYCPLISFKN